MTNPHYEHGWLEDATDADETASRLGLPRLTDISMPLTPLHEGRLPVKFIRCAKIVPLRETGHACEIAMAAPADGFVLQALELVLGKAIQPHVATTSQIEQLQNRLYGDAQLSLADIAQENDDDGDRQEESPQQLRDLAAEAPIIRLVNRMLDRALELRASDVHIEAFERHIRVRYRVDGVLQASESLPLHCRAAILSRLKIMARLDIAERRLPQDGRIRICLRERNIDLRISTVPTTHGECVVVRILDQSGVQLDLAALGFADDIAAQLQEILARPHGISLVTGPTGSGKTTTLYALLQILNTPGRKILTVEDPVEYQLEGINQIPIRPKVDFNFANALRAIVRQDPDVIMIGEMRDLETARISMQSALTGHLVLSTLHTNNAGSSLTRLLDMGVEDFLITSTLIAVLAQRLVRKVCWHCREICRAAPEITTEFAELDKHRLYRATGCRQCTNSGYLGRSMIHELLLIDESARRLVLEHADGVTLQQQAVAAGMRSMKADGIARVCAGITTIEEVLRVIRNI